MKAAGGLGREDNSEGESKRRRRRGKQEDNRKVITGSGGRGGRAVGWRFKIMRTGGIKEPAEGE